MQMLIRYLSRAPLPYNIETVDEDYEVHSYTISQITCSIVTHKLIKEETEKYEELSQMKCELLSGKSTSAEFSLHEGVILRGSRIVIPKSLQPHILNELHSNKYIQHIRVSFE